MGNNMRGMAASSQANSAGAPEYRGIAKSAARIRSSACCKPLAILDFPGSCSGAPFAR
jgi:uncharacterized protein YceK